MGHDKITGLLRLTFDNVHLALWSALIAGLVLFAALVVPNLPEARARYVAARAAQIEAEHDFYCRKWRMTPGSGAYRGCMSDLQQFRRTIEQEMAADSFF